MKLPRETFNNLEGDKQQRILAIAIDEFASHGFRQASMNRMVQKLAIAKGSLFQYFVNKEGLFRVIFDHAVELVRRSLRQVRQDTAEQDFFQRIGQSLSAGIRFIQKHPKIYRIYLKMIFQEDFPLRAEFLQQVHLFSSEYLRPLVEKGIADGELRSDLDVNMTVFFLDALMDRFLQAYCVSFLDAGAGIYGASESDLERYVDEFIGLIRTGMSAAVSEGKAVDRTGNGFGLQMAVGMEREVE
ncbi:TetR/AcrR family transcriptional regulator [Desulfoferrobacter suflitae]|uniref:TetR/AcrR family transcriptional regulator n=1 Tax=Desulfoferrobacter suflitae TaxID=2865782 RepID=UPI002164CE7E|nr:TetR/AcrR family transcriptional regulator [Desulfoferrobacter suflitae]MCK8603233.1 TetR/AcrR family transcriptional regulator [Desulfoferrobacter suflitae]